MLVLVVDDLDQLVPRLPQPEERRDVGEVAQLLVQPGNRVVGQADVGAQTVGPENKEKYF